jgi:serine/threonine protein kinase/tetratricopeptide (TPR) repeat protein
MNRDVKDIFLHAIELPPEERATFLDERCAGDAPLRAAVEELLSAHARATVFLAGPTISPGTLAGSATSAALNSEVPIDQGLSLTPRQIGPYKVLQMLGEGGFGTVYLAEQEQPVRRRVALKIIKLGMDTRQVIARFEQERQALAMMDHPNIAKVFDAGATEAGRPYFVMELVKGIPITQYCDEHRIGLRQRLELFIPICQAVQHAHQKGIIHRDIKPTNVLVTMHDDKPVPKVIDFGIAKATQSRLTEKTVFTELRQMIGTPEYMSPEQAEMTGLDIDTRSDIYSLGVLLYELLTGATPFDPRELRSRAYAEIQRIIREVEPPRPSTRLSTIEALPSVAAQRGVEPQKLHALLRGELDWIVMKCLEKDRARRYDTASSLASDVARYLADEPVTAVAPSQVYRLRKFVRRNRGPVVASLVIVLLLIGGITGTTIGLIGEAKQRAEAQRQAREAENSAAIAQAVSQFQADMLSSADPDRLLGDKVTVLQAITGAVKELDAGTLKDEPLVEAAVRETIGSTLRALGRYDDAESHLRKSLELRRTLLPPAHRLVGIGLNYLAFVLQDKGELTEAERLLREALEITRKTVSPDDRELATALNNVASLLQDQGRHDEAEPLVREALTIDRRALAPHDSRVATELGNLGHILKVRGKLEESEPVLREALEIERKSRPAGHPQIAQGLNDLALVLQARGKLDEAERMFREALELRRAALPVGHPFIAQSMTNLAGLLQGQGNLLAAEQLHREALEMCRKAYSPDHPSVAAALNNLAMSLRAQGKLAEAEPMFREVLRINLLALGPIHQNTALAQHNLAGLLFEQRKFEEAEQLYREALSLSERKFGKEHWQVANARLGLGRTLLGLRRYAEAEPLLLEAERVLAVAQGAPPGRHERCVQELVALYESLEKLHPGQGHADKARQWRAKLPVSRPTTREP